MSPLARAVLLAGLSLPLSLALSSCDDGDFVPAWKVETLRVVAVVADPPDALPGEPVSLTLVHADRAGPERPLSVAWTLCDRSAMDPSTGARACGEGLSAPLLGATIRVTAPALHDRGSWVLFGYACAGGTPSLDPSTGRPSCEGGDGLTFFRTLPARRSSANHNPVITSVTLGGERLTEGTPSMVRVCPSDRGACAGLPLEVAFSDDSREPAETLSADGRVGTQPEALITTFLADGGELDGAFRSDGDSGASARHTNTFKPPSTPGRVRLWVAARDGRGGFAALSLALDVTP